MDCKSEAYPLMAGTQLRILVDELRRAGVTSIQIGPGSDADG
jgi:2-succinyl-5-enolpyruvyl-6-hydroxy-3-cyclohexene-1-carboxylate synthase